MKPEVRLYITIDDKIYGVSFATVEEMLNPVVWEAAISNLYKLLKERLGK